MKTDRFTPIVAVIAGVVVLVAGWWLFSALLDNANYMQCEKSSLCKTVTLARVGKETGADITADGGIVFRQRANPMVTHELPPTPPVVVQQPVPPAKQASIQYTGRNCPRKDGSTGREGYGPDGSGKLVLGCWKN